MYRVGPSTQVELEEHGLLAHSLIPIKNKQYYIETHIIGSIT